jgi:hypothetical protein
MIDEPLEISLMRQSLDYLERAYELMLDHETVLGSEHKEFLDKIEDCIDRLLYLQVAGNARRGPKYQHTPMQAHYKVTE